MFDIKRTKLKFPKSCCLKERKRRTKMNRIHKTRMNRTIFFIFPRSLFNPFRLPTFSLCFVSFSSCDSLRNDIFNKESRSFRSLAGLFSVTERVTERGRCRLWRDGLFPMSNSLYCISLWRNQKKKKKVLFVCLFTPIDTQIRSIPIFDKWQSLQTSCTRYWGKFNFSFFFSQLTSGILFYFTGTCLIHFGWMTIMARVFFFGWFLIQSSRWTLSNFRESLGKENCDTLNNKRKWLVYFKSNEREKERKKKNTG